MGERFAEKIDHNFRFSWRSSLRMGSESRGNSWYGYIGKIARHIQDVLRTNGYSPKETFLDLLWGVNEFSRYRQIRENSFREKGEENKKGRGEDTFCFLKLVEMTHQSSFFASACIANTAKSEQSRTRKNDSICIRKTFTTGFVIDSFDSIRLIFRILCISRYNDVVSVVISRNNRLLVINSNNLASDRISMASESSPSSMDL